MPATTASITRLVVAARKPGKAPMSKVRRAKLKVNQRLVTWVMAGHSRCWTEEKWVSFAYIEEHILYEKQFLFARVNEHVWTGFTIQILTFNFQQNQSLWPS